MRFYCKCYKGHELTQVCMFFSPGIDYSCLNKKTGFKNCPWVGKPWSQPTGYYLGPTDMIHTTFGADNDKV